MTRRLFFALFLPLLAAECVAKFVMHDQAWTIVFALLALAVIAVRWARGPQTADERACPSESTDPEFESFAWEHGDLKRGEEL